MRIALVVLCLALVSCNDPSANSPAASQTKAVESAPATQASRVPAIIFLQYLNQQAPVVLCQQDAGIACLNMPVELCQASVAQSSERCGPKLLAQWPAEFAESQANAVKYSQAYRNCMLNDWVTEFGLQPERLSACGIELN